MPAMRTRLLVAAGVLLLALPAVAAAITRTGQFTAGFAANTHTRSSRTASFGVSAV